jgi:hypothetical protein
MMKKNLNKEDPEGMALEDLMAAMGQLRQRKLQPSAPVSEIPPGMMPPEGPGRDVRIGGGEFSQPMAGIDPRLAELIRKKKSGAL